jgi:hypothetical protein
VVITEERAIKLLSEANPVPDPSTLDVNGTFPATRLAEYDARSKMTDLRTNKTDSTRAPSRRLVMIGALAAAAVVALGILILPRMAERQPVAGPSLTPVETAEAFLDAYRGRFDVDEAFNYLGAEPESVGLNTAGAANYHLFARFLEATGSQLVDLKCEELSASAEGTVVGCTWWTHDFFSDELGLGPFGPDADQLTIVDGKVISIVNSTDQGPYQFSNQIWEPFADWIEENHPDDRAVMYDPFPNGWRITDESIPVWVQRLREYVAEVTGQKAAESPTMGLPGLPPPGATPSAPETGELVASMWEHIGAPGSFGNGWMYVYADGRLIWEQLDPAPTGGWLERRLSNEGVELIRSEIIDTGLFNPDQPPPAPNGGFPRETNGGTIQVRVGDRLVYVNRVVPELFERMSELWSWLPEEAWADTDEGPYVPSRYAACLDSQYLAGLPPAAQGLLAGQFQMEEMADLDPALSTLVGEWNHQCYILTVEGARALTMELSAGGIEERPPSSDAGSEIFYTISSEPGAEVSFWPMLPHGVPGFTGA